MQKKTRSRSLKYTLKSMNGITIETNLRKYEKVITQIKCFPFQDISEMELKRKIFEVKKRTKTGEKLAQNLPLVFALVNEIIKRKLKMIPFEEQIAAGIAMHERKCVQMQTGEGKTLAAVFPVVLNALSGQVHV